MKTVKLFLLVFFAGALMLSCGNSTQKTDDKSKAATEKDLTSKVIDIDRDVSVVNWLGSLVGVYDHYGLLKFKSGNLVVENGVIKSGSFVVDMTTMAATDDNYDAEKGSTKDKLIGHLSSPDFFSVEEFPEASFVIKSHTDNVIKGALTIRGKVNEEEVQNVKVEKIDGKLVFTGELIFDRQKYDVAWKHPMKDKVLKDNIELKIKLVE